MSRRDVVLLGPKTGVSAVRLETLQRIFRSTVTRFANLVLQRDIPLRRHPIPPTDPSIEVFVDTSGVGEITATILGVPSVPEHNLVADTKALDPSASFLEFVASVCLTRENRAAAEDDSGDSLAAFPVGDLSFQSFEL